MPAFGYIMNHNQYQSLEDDLNWMRSFGCEAIIQEKSEFEKFRPKWKELLKSLKRNDVIVIPKLSNVVESTSDLAFFLDYCRREEIRIISIHDELDTYDRYYPAKSTKAIFDIIASIPEEVTSIKNAYKRVAKIKKISETKPGRVLDKKTRDTQIINLYKNGIAIDEIWKMSGFKSRSSIFRILKDNGIPVNRIALKKNTKGDSTDKE